MTEITDQMIEIVAAIIHHVDGTGTHPDWSLEWDYVRADYLLQAKAVLEKVTPIIASRAVHEAADDAEKLADAQERCGLPVAGHTRQLAENLRRRGERIARGSNR